MGRADVIGRLVGDRIVVEVDMHVGEHRARGLGAFDPFQRAGQMGVRRMRLLSHPRKMPSMAGYDLEIVGFEPGE